MLKTHSYKKYTLSNLSNPKLLSILYLISLLVVFSLETLGLGNKEKNVEMMITSLEKSKNRKIKLILTF